MNRARLAVARMPGSAVALRLACFLGVVTKAAHASATTTTTTPVTLSDTAVVGIGVGVTIGIIIVVIIVVLMVRRARLAKKGSRRRILPEGHHEAQRQALHEAVDSNRYAKPDRSARNAKAAATAAAATSRWGESRRSGDSASTSPKSGTKSRWKPGRRHAAGKANGGGVAERSGDADSSAMPSSPTSRSPTGSPKPGIGKQKSIAPFQRMHSKKTSERRASLTVAQRLHATSSAASAAQAFDLSVERHKSGVSEAQDSALARRQAARLARQAKRDSAAGAVQSESKADGAADGASADRKEGANDTAEAKTSTATRRDSPTELQVEELDE